jgi:hypothetical protein
MIVVAGAALALHLAAAPVAPPAQAADVAAKASATTKKSSGAPASKAGASTSQAGASTTQTPQPAGPPLTGPQLVVKARQQYDALEYEAVAAAAEQALASNDLTLEQKLDAYALQGSALAIVADPTDAEKPFRLLLRARPEFNLPDATPPKILAVFRKVQVEERAIVEEVTALQRQRLAATLKLSGEAPAHRRGGRPLVFRYRLRDPQGAVDTVRVQYRKQGDAEFTSLPLVRDDAGVWLGRIPGEWTASAQGFELQYVVVGADDKGTLVSLGSPATPLSLAVAPGEVDKNAHPVPAWGFWTAAGATTLAAATAGVLAGVTARVNADFRDTLASSTPESPADGGEVVRTRAFGINVMTAQFVGWGVTGLGVVVTGLLAPFTNWGAEDGADDTAAAPAATTALTSSTTAMLALQTRTATALTSSTTATLALKTTTATALTTTATATLALLTSSATALTSSTTATLALQTTTDARAP